MKQKVNFLTFKYITCSSLVLLMLTIWSTALTQLNFEFQPTLIVKKNAVDLPNAWAGGLDYTQFSTIDIDFDGDEDLFLFDRSSNNIRVFSQEVENGVKKWKSVYNAKNLFPSDLEYRATMADFDGDGKNDLFTYSIGGLKVYKNIGNASDGLQWQLFKEIVYSNYNGFQSNLYVASSDIPAIVDVDGDGDLDILTFHQGGSHLEYHKNMSMEQFGHADSLQFILANECWGKFSENVNNNSITLNDTNYPCVGGSITNPQLPTKPGAFIAQKEGSMHAGSTVLAIDLDNSGVLDLILGDVAYTNLVSLINGGTAPNTNSAMVSFDMNFPSNSTPASMYLFPAAYFLDVDFDGVKDLIIGANAKNVSQNESSILFYKNIGTNSLPIFIYQKNNFLQDEMIEHGKGTVPIVYDVNGDGLKDLLVANLYRYKNETTKESTIAYYRNTGTATTPIYTFVDFNWLNLSSYNYGLRLIPTFGDINGDGNEEMLLGRENGSLVLFQNNGSTFHTPTINFKDNLNQTIQVGGFSFPQLIDLNKDGLLDLVIGNRMGKVVYYQNIGTTTSPSFQLINSSLGNVQIIDNNNPDGYAAPHFFTLNDTLQLFLGGVDGKLHYYTDIEGNLESGSSFQLQSDHFLQISTDAFSSFYVSDIDNDGNLNLFVGQDLGGLWHFEVDPTSSVGIEEINYGNSMELFPNPTSSSLYINSTSNLRIRLRLYTIDGVEILQTSFFNTTQIDLTPYKNGIYLVECLDQNGQKQVFRVVKNE